MQYKINKFKEIATTMSLEINTNKSENMSVNKTNSISINWDQSVIETVQTSTYLGSERNRSLPKRHISWKSFQHATKKLDVCSLLLCGCENTNFRQQITLKNLANILAQQNNEQRFMATHQSRTKKNDN